MSPLSIVDVGVEGQGLARHNGRVVFLDGGLPGALVSAIVRRVSKKACFADIVSFLAPSPHEVPAPCPHALVCGACLWQHFDLEAARQWKRNHIAQCLARIGKAPQVPVAPLVASPQNRNFRNKMSFAFGPGPENNCLLGLRSRGGHDIVEINSCLLQDAPVMELLAFVRQRVNELGLPAWTGRGKGASGYLRHLVTRRSHYGLLVECISGPAWRKAARQSGADLPGLVKLLGNELMERFSLSGFVHGERHQADDLALSERKVCVLGNDYLKEQIGHLELRVPCGAFLQTNTGAAEELYALIEREAALTGREVVWDLFCGIGSIGLYLARGAGQVHGCESVKDSLQAARQNARDLGYDNCRFYQIDLSKGLDADLPAPDVVIVDPPRAGLSEALIAHLLKVKPRVLLYVSCDVGTQARDCARLSEKWLAQKALPVDMFPGTPHVENILVFTARQ
ncbi:23S rRNA (uracil(1939)-C(5))-methyltransferase RlmD [Desulfovibrio sp. OttesenSCG-928-M16]|nr:23S rRNA (uracil(1939)-C(5))-methyltransferase RlmD [Desulfovibrio sp. OttesenSCG-928-M16]